MDSPSVIRGRDPDDLLGRDRQSHVHWVFPFCPSLRAFSRTHSRRNRRSGSRCFVGSNRSRGVEIRTPRKAATAGSIASLRFAAACLRCPARVRRRAVSASPIFSLRAPGLSRGSGDYAVRASRGFVDPHPPTLGKGRERLGPDFLLGRE
jgi:hypothetical protein